MPSGIFPESILCATLSCSRLFRSLNVLGIGPISLLKLTSNTVRFLSIPISGGRHEFKPLFIKIISFRFDMFPKLDGTQPWNLLFATTITDTGEFPKLSGRLNTNLLWLMKMASNGLSKSSRGTDPSNSLNLRSKNFSDGSFRITTGNFPANLLLLRSNSKSNFRFLNL
jgi:hypothetical protein